MKNFLDEIWWETNKDGTVSIGFTQSFIARKMAECFHVIPANTKRVEKDEPMLVLETNDALESVKAPVSGKVNHFASKARNFPDRLKESDVILTLMPPEVEAKMKQARVEKSKPDVFALEGGFDDGILREQVAQMRQEQIFGRRIIRDDLFAVNNNNNNQG